MAMETVTVRMSRSDEGTAWGFRLEGGQEFGVKLYIGKVVHGSLADRAGLKEYDSLTTLAGRPTSNMTHKEAENIITSCRNNLDLVVGRSGSGGGYVGAGTNIWKPTYTPVEQRSTTVTQKSSTITTSGQAPGEAPPLAAPTPVKVSLEHRTDSRNVPGYNITPRPFAPGGGGGPRVQHLQYNTPAPLYSGKSATEEYLHQTGGMFGTDPSQGKPKEEPKFLQSETLRLIHQTEGDKSSPHHQHPHHHQYHPPPPAQHIYEDRFAQGREETLHHSEAAQQSGSFKRLTTALAADDISLEDTPVVRETREGGGLLTHTEAHHAHSEGAPVCGGCGRNVTGVFCKAGGKTLHPDCFTCATCGNSLKNTGYYLVHDKLYCDIHAAQHKQDQFSPRPPVDPGTFAARAPPPAKPVVTSEPIKAFYQPEILKPGPAAPVGVSWRQATSPLPPSSRGVPKQFNMYTSTTSETTSYGGGGYPQQPAPALAPAPVPAPAPAPAPVSSAPFSSPPTGGSSGAPAWAPPSDMGSLISGARQPRRGRGILKQLHDVPRVPFCEACHKEIRGPFILAMNKTWCPEHFICANGQCRRKLQDIGFVEENNQIYCEYCFEQYLAPQCAKCSRPVTGDCLNAVDRQWHPECFTCASCHKPFGNSTFFLEEGKPYCEADWNQLFTTKCVSCLFPIEAGDRWVEALGNAYHSNCFTCTMCHKNLEGQSFYAKGGRPYCKAHA